MLGGHGERNGPAKQTNGPRSRSPKDSTSSTARGSESSIAVPPPTLSFPGSKGASKGDPTPQELVASAVQEHFGSITTKLVESLQPVESLQLVSRRKCLQAGSNKAGIVN